jgi:exonuclease VII small subunit
MEMVFQFILLSLLITVGVLGYFFYNAVQEIELLKSALDKLNESFAELDEQAKLIVKTDLELNKAQEELDKRLNGLDALQKNIAAHQHDPRRKRSLPATQSVSDPGIRI